MYAIRSYYGVLGGRARVKPWSGSATVELVDAAGHRAKMEPGGSYPVNAGRVMVIVRSELGTVTQPMMVPIGGEGEDGRRVPASVDGDLRDAGCVGRARFDRVRCAPGP